MRNFKWEYLTEKLAYERRIRESKINLAMSKAKKVNSDFVEKIEKTASLGHIIERKSKRGREDSKEAENPTAGAEALEWMKKKFKQSGVLASQHGENQAQLFDSNFIKKLATKST